jgi:hypothetical protein
MTLTFVTSVTHNTNVTPNMCHTVSQCDTMWHYDPKKFQNAKQKCKKMQKSSQLRIKIDVTHFDTLTNHWHQKSSNSMDPLRRTKAQDGHLLVCSKVKGLPKPMKKLCILSPLTASNPISAALYTNLNVRSCLGVLHCCYPHYRALQKWRRK